MRKYIIVVDSGPCHHFGAVLEPEHVGHDRASSLAIMPPWRSLSFPLKGSTTEGT